MPVSNFTNMQPFVVTADDAATRWSGMSPKFSFRCAWCGHQLQEGDTARWVYTNTEAEHQPIRGNPFICGTCDGPDAIERLLAMAEKVRQVKADCWWFFRYDDEWRRNGRSTD